MSASEYLAFLPLLIYGIALADLFRRWNRFMNLKQIFIPYLLLTLIFLILESSNVLILYFTPGTRHGNGLGVFNAYETWTRLISSPQRDIQRLWG